MCVIQKIQITLIIFGITVNLEVSCLGKNLFCQCNCRIQHFKSYWVSFPLQLKIKTRVMT